MRVLHVINQFSGRAGAEVSLRDLVVTTQGRGIRHAIAVLKPEPNDFTDTDAAGVPRFVPRGQLGRLGSVRHIRAAAATFSPDLVHTSLFEADVAGRVAARLSGIPVMTSLVNTTYAAAAEVSEPTSVFKRRLARRMDGLLARRATSFFHAISEAVADDAAAALRIPRERIHVVPRGRSRHVLGAWSLERRTRSREALGLEPDQPIVINVARHEPQKGQRHLLEALRAIRSTHQDVVLLIVGREGRSTAQLQREAAATDIADSVRWLGVRQDVHDLLCAADVFAFPSLWEGLGGAVLEAMALRIPIVASDIPALREVLDEERCGLLVPPADASALADGILTALEGGSNVTRATNAAEQRFLAHYELHAIASAMLNLYRVVLNIPSR